MRVLLISAEYPPLPGGVGDYSFQLGTELHRRGIDVQVITSRSPGPAPADLSRHVVSAWDWRCLKEIPAIMRRLRPDLLHIQYQTGAFAMHPAINLLPWVVRMRVAPIPVLVTCHDLRLPYLLPKAGGLRRWVMRRMLQDAAAVIVTNAEDAARLRGELPGDRNHFAASKPLTPLVIPIGSNIAVCPTGPGERAFWRRRMGAADGDIVLAYFGLTNRSKGVDLLLRALAQLAGHVRLAIIGGEPGASDSDNRRYAAELVALADELGVSGRVWRSGQLPAQEVSAALQSCDIAALPFRDGVSYRRGSLLAVLAHGLPLISTRPLVRLEPPLEHEGAALLLDGDEAALPYQIAEATLRLAADAALCKRLGDAAQLLARQFAWQTIAARHVEIYSLFK